MTVNAHLFLFIFTCVRSLSETVSLPSQGRGKAAYNLPFPDPTLWDYTAFVVVAFHIIKFTLFSGVSKIGIISWLFLSAIAAGMYFNVPGEYLYIGAAVFTIVFCIIEMDKPSEAHNFEPQIYNMERGARDKLISDYNTMDIWEFNEKYGDIWDFTVKIQKDDIMKR
uniref:Photosynthetic NDH subunit of subcomplex B 5, chloroplastic-like n=1 Tax=Nicotiana tabacum TaxID=4097 RepID=A0A1S4BQJ0_TOBAC|nr:PREDICTED: photosynthetic NDH subunit of subcomplex B 5, chloroplastic-like [Nicotiana tabacum]